ncbi:MAG: universal stress protein [Cytophagales bacterium]|nr:universal stress protein [Cytophaga sp.]
MELKSILCPIDFSEAGVQALKYAAILSSRFNSTLHVFHSCHVPTSITEAIGIDTSTEIIYDNEEVYRKKIEKLLQEVITEELKDIQYNIIVRYGFASDAIAEVTEEVHADLVVMYTSGADNFLQYMLGTVTGHVLKNVLCPVLIVPHDFIFNGTIKEIVYATDLLTEAEDSVESVVALAKKFEAHISFISIESHAVAERRNLVPYALNELLQKTSYTHISFHINESEHVIEGLRVFAAERDADLLVMTTRSRNFIKNVIEKSKTREIVFHSTIPVLAFHK